MNKPLIASISDRESEVLRLISLGHTSNEIASKLFISVHTASTHRKNLINKMQVRNTAGLVRRAFEYRLLEIA